METYALLADSMASHPALQIFRRFSALNVKSILYYEAELAFLESFLKTVEGQDSQSRELLRHKFGDKWYELAFGDENMRDVGTSSSGNESGVKGNEDPEKSQGARTERHWNLICRIRTVLDAYHRAVECQIEVENKCNQPRRRDLAKLREWHNDPRFGKGSLLGTIEDVWDSEQREDFPARPASDYIAAASTGDALSYLLGGWLLNLKGSLAGRNERGVPDTESHKAAGYGKHQSVDKIRSLNADDALKVTNGILTVLASTLPVVPVVVLYVIKSMPVRVGLIFVFTMIMSAVATFGLSINAEKTIAIATAFAAVQVVFISTNNVA